MALLILNAFLSREGTHAPKYKILRWSEACASWIYSTTQKNLLKELRIEQMGIQLDLEGAVKPSEHRIDGV